MNAPAGRRELPPRLARDEGLRRVSVLSKWIGVAALALVGAIAGFVAQAKPGRSTQTARAHSASRSASRSAKAPSNGSGVDRASSSPAGGNPALAPPPALPTPTPAPSTGITSGGS